MEIRNGNELTLGQILVIYKKRRRVVWGTVLVLASLCGLYCAVATRRYEATGTVQIQKESSDGLGLDSLMSEAGGDASDALEVNIVIETQATILQSDTLAIRTIQNLHMEDTEDFKPRWSPISWAWDLLTPKGPQDKPGVSLDEAPERRRHALKVFLKNLTVKPVTGTRLIEINYLNPDPKLSAAVVNELTQGLIDYTFQTRYNATNQASAWLTGQLTELRKQSEDLQAKVVNLERQSGVYSLGTVDAQGREQAYSGVLDQLQQQTTALSMAQQNRILKEAIAKAAETGNGELLSGLSGNTMVGGMSMNNTLALIVSLRQQEATEQAALKEAEAKFGSAYPKLAEMRANLAGVQRSIQEEVQRIKDRAESDYSVSEQTEKNTRAQYEGAKKKADLLNDKAIEYMIVRQEAEESRELYEDLLKRLKEAGVLEGLKSSNITVVDPGRIPSKPKKPDVPIYMLVSLAVGFVVGCLGALLVDTLDNKVGSIQEVEDITGQTILGATPWIEATVRQPATQGKTPLPTIEDSQSTFAEALRSIRTAILLTGGGDRSRVILVTSSIPGEGKSTISSNLSVVLSQSNRKVLLVDSDLRRGTLYRKFGQKRASGLSELLAGQDSSPNINTVADVPNLYFLQSGTPPPNPSELLDLKMAEWIAKWRNQYDFILVDGPPLLPVTDAQIVHPYADITLLLARSGVTERAQIQRSYRLLSKSSKHFIGIIMNGLRPQDENYYGYYGYRKYSYHYGEDQNANSD